MLLQNVGEYFTKLDGVTSQKTVIYNYLNTSYKVTVKLKQGKAVPVFN
jgi:hypothetical protein